MCLLKYEGFLISLLCLVNIPQNGLVRGFDTKLSTCSNITKKIHVDLLHYHE